MIDARLASAAVAAWVGAAVTVVWLASEVSVVHRHLLAVHGGIAMAVALAILMTVVGAWTVRGRRRRWCGAALVVLSLLVTGSGAACLAVLRTTPDPVAGWIDARATAVVRAVITGEPEERRASSAQPWAPPSWVQVRVVTQAVSARSQTVDVAVPMVVRVDAGQGVPAPGSVVALTGRLAPAPAQTGLAATIAAGDVVVLGHAGPIDTAAQAMRVGLRSALAGAPADGAALVAGLAIGDTTAASADLVAAMRTSGLSHLTAVSGGNVAIVLGTLLVLTAVVRAPLLVRAVLACAGLAFFVLLVGPQASVLRAAAMGVVTLVAVVTGGRRAGPSVLSAAVLVLVLVDPWLAVSWGFALSTLATAGLVLMAPYLRDRLEERPRAARWPPPVLDAVALTLAAQLATAPVLAAMGATVGWVAIPANLLAVPVVAPVTIGGLAAALLGPVLPGVAGVVAHLAAWPAGWIAVVAEVTARVPGGAVPLPSGWWGVVAVLTLPGVAIALRSVGRRLLGDPVPRRLRRALGMALAAALVLVVLLPPSRRGWPPPGWLMIMCDVGQGDALLLRAGEDEAVVVDAGPDPGLVDRCLRDARISAIPAVVLTHFHADHTRGLAGVLAGRTVGTVLSSPIREPAAEAEEVADLLRDGDVPAGVITAGDHRIVGDVEWQAIWPRRRVASGSIPNNASVVLAVRIRGRSLLLCGDVEPEAQVAIAPDLAGRRFDVVKVPHHGSRYLDPRFPGWAPAPVALVSVGADNDYGHPAPTTIAAWESIGALVVRTDLDGDVAVVETPSGSGVVTRRDLLLPR